MMLVVAAAASVLAYAGLLLAAARILRRMRAFPPMDDAELPFVSVLVAARDEERDLPRCLAALGAQDYPQGRLEFVVADDGSTDATPAVIDAAAEADARFRRVSVDAHAGTGSARGKARALHAAYAASRGELLLMTDADCAPPPGWARHLASQFADPSIDVVCGVTAVEEDGRLGRVQALDWLLLLAAASAAAEAGRPITAMGNNMGVRRSAYERVGGYPGLPFSVTEDYALVRAIDARAGGVRLLADPAVLNRTRPLGRLRDVIAQRRRWARGGLRAPAWIYAVYTAVYLAHLFPVVCLFVAPLAGGALLAAKASADAYLLDAAQRRLGLPRRLRGIFLFQVYYTLYVVAMPFLLLLRPRITWKGRRH